jgi:hypothetical protein
MKKQSQTTPSNNEVVGSKALSFSEIIRQTVIVSLLPHLVLNIALPFFSLLIAQNSNRWITRRNSHLNGDKVFIIYCPSSSSQIITKIDFK